MKCIGDCTLHTPPEFTFATRVARLRRCGHSTADAIRLVASVTGEAVIDSHKLARLFTEHDLTYIQYCLREAPHVCRHTVGEGRYRVHPEPECSPDCDEKYAATAPLRASGRCPDCNLTIPEGTECFLCQ